MTGHRWPAGRNALVALWCLSLLLALVLILSRSVEPTMPVYFELATALRNGPLTSSFEPLGYPWLISLMPPSSLETAVKLLHGACFLMLASAFTWLGIRSLDAPLSVGRRLAVVAVVAGMLLSPYQLVNLVRLNDNGVTVLLVFLAFALPQIASWRLATGQLMQFSAAATLGVTAFVRPNCWSLLPFVAAFACMSVEGRSRRVMTASAVVAVCVAAYILCAIAATGRASFWPSNGPYNVFAGNNPSTLDALRRDYNAEPSLSGGLSWCGVDAAPRAATSAALMACTRRYLIERPVDAAVTTAYKAYNMLWRPNVRLATSVVKASAQVAMLALPVAWWVVGVAILFRSGFVFDWPAAAFVFLFTVPFVLTNSDPRFRLPLEPIYALSLLRWFGARPVAS